MHRILLTTAALTLSVAATPASAQLLGGGGGGLGGGLGGSLGGSLGGTLRSPGTMTESTLRRSSSGELRTERQVDRRSGRVRAGGSASRTTDTAIDGRSPIGGGSASTRGSAGGSGSLDAQLVGTDALRATARGAAGEARGLATRGRGAAGAALGTVRETATSAAGSARGNGSSMAGGAVGASDDMLALTGSAAASGAGSLDVQPGMTVVDAKGRAIGTVRDLRSDAEGRVRDVIVQVGDRTATLPATSFSGEGNVLVSAMTRKEVQREAAE